MKSLSIFFFFIAFSCFSQTIDYEGEKFLLFDLKYPSDRLTIDGIDWSKEKTISEFTLKGTTSLEYSVQIENDTTALLSYKENGKWKFQEKLGITGWAISRIDNDKIISEFKIVDFDKDGDEDLTCWVNSNMNGNIWTIILLNDQKSRRLVKLYNTADDTDIWDRPEFDKQKSIINTTLDASLFGISNEATYRLENVSVFPLKKYEENRSSGKYILENEYIGNNSKWKLVKSKKQK